MMWTWPSGSCLYRVLQGLTPLTGNQALTPTADGCGAGAVGSLELLFSCNLSRASPRRLSTSVHALPPKLGAACLWSEPPTGRWLHWWCYNRKWPYVPPSCSHLWPKAIAPWPDPRIRLLASCLDSTKWILPWPSGHLQTICVQGHSACGGSPQPHLQISCSQSGCPQETRFSWAQQWCLHRAISCPSCFHMHLDNAQTLGSSEYGKGRHWVHGSAYTPLFLSMKTL